MPEVEKAASGVTADVSGDHQMSEGAERGQVGQVGGVGGASPAGPAGAADSAGAPDPAAGADDGERGGETPLTDQERRSRLEQLQAIIDLMRPAVQADGGDLVLLSADVETGVIEVQLNGACSSCAISSATLQGGVERILMGRLPWVTEVLGGVDESMDLFESAEMGQGGYVPRAY